MIPGTKIPAGTHIPYVVIVSTYQRKKYVTRFQMKTPVPLSVESTIRAGYLKNYLIVPPSVLKTRVASGLYLSGSVQ